MYNFRDSERFCIMDPRITSNSPARLTIMNFDKIFRSFVMKNA